MERFTQDRRALSNRRRQVERSRRRQSSPAAIAAAPRRVARFLIRHFGQAALVGLVWVLAGLPLMIILERRLLGPRRLELRQAFGLRPPSLAPASHADQLSRR